ncbi:peptidase M14 [Flavobacteriales bacterium 33_180_T64]|nr:peptidase M14 [Flavobacteriales bacterium 33_180_T64]
MRLETLKSLFKTYKETLLFGRYIHHESVAPILEKLDKKIDILEVGKSVNGIPIYTLTFGCGEKKILMWSQMHGNESTTTKAVFDLLNCVSDENFSAILNTCTIKIIPILSPDGAKAYTRLNANGVDLNRDAQNLSQPESKVLRSVFDDFKPHFCFNLHGQRTIFSAGNTCNPATVSFLAPAQEEERLVTSTRKIAMEVISMMNNNLQKQIVNQVGVYDDGFNINCVGDTFQALNVPTILFEAGHYAGDYMREQTREFIFQSLLVSLSYISENQVNGDYCQLYFDIPKNRKRFYDIIVKNTSDLDVAIQYQEELIDNSLVFVPKVEKISDLRHYCAHNEIDARGSQVFEGGDLAVVEGSEIDFVVVGNEKFLLKL